MEMVWNISVEFWDVLSEMAPYLLLGFAVAGVISVFLSAAWVERHLGGEGFWANFKASAFGVPLPLCSCGVIPVAASLRRHGAGRGATTAFLISTPQTGVDSILVTFSLLGWAFAIFRTLAAFLSGLLGGAWVSLGAEKSPSPEPQPESCGCGASDCEDSHSPPKSRWRRMLFHGFIELPQDIGPALLVGLVISALITVLIPEDFFAEALGGGILAMLVMLAVGIPVYVCATASVPVAATMMLHAGISPGAALVFLMTGPATNAATLAIVYKTMGRRTAGLYLLSVAASALGAGLLLDWTLDIGDFQVGPEMSWMLPGWFKSLCAAALLAILGWGILKKFRPHHQTH